MSYEFTGGEGGWPGDVPHFVLDVAAINRLGWKARHTSEQAIAMAIRCTLNEFAEGRHAGRGSCRRPWHSALAPDEGDAKPMVPVRNVPYLEHQLRLFARQSLTDIVILTGYLGRADRGVFWRRRRLGLRIRYSREPEPLGTAGPLARRRISWTTLS